MLGSYRSGKLLFLLLLITNSADDGLSYELSSLSDITMSGIQHRPSSLASCCSWEAMRGSTHDQQQLDQIAFRTHVSCQPFGLGARPQLNIPPGSLSIGTSKMFEKGPQILNVPRRNNPVTLSDSSKLPIDQRSLIV